MSGQRKGHGTRSRKRPARPKPAVSTVTPVEVGRVALPEPEKPAGFWLGARLFLHRLAGALRVFV